MFPALVIAVALASQEPPAPIQDPLPPAEQGAEEVGPDTVVASVGESEITMAELVAEVNRQIPLNFYHGEVPVEKKREFRDKALATLIERKLILLDAMERGLQATDEELRAELRKSIQIAGATDRVDEQMFEELLVQIGPDLRTRVLVDKNEARFASTVPQATEDDLRKAYEDQKSHLVLPEMVQLREILLQVRPGSTEEQALAVRARLELILDELDKGGDFAALAMIHSEHESASTGGDRGLVSIKRMRAPELSAAVEKLADGEHSGPIRTRYGYHLVLRERTEPTRPLEYEEVRDGLRMQVAKALADQARTTWLDAVRARHPVVVSDIVKDGPEEGSADQTTEPTEARAER